MCWLDVDPPGLARPSTTHWRGSGRAISAADQQVREQVTGAATDTPCSFNETWWFIQAPEKRSDRGRSQLALLQTTSELNRTVSPVAQDFASRFRPHPMDAEARRSA